MRIKQGFFVVLLLLSVVGFSQDGKFKKFKKLSSPEKCWVIWHPFKAKKALRISELARQKTDSIRVSKVLEGKGNGDQVDAFRHTFWMAKLTKEIGWRGAKSLGKAHEKGNYKDYKKRRLEDGVIPDKISSDMDIFNNDVGIEIGKTTIDGIEKKVVAAVLEGKCKIIKRDAFGNFLTCNDKVVTSEELKGKWVNDKCLVNSNFKH